MFIARGSVSQLALGKLPQHTSCAQYLGISVALFGASFGIAMAVRIGLYPIVTLGEKLLNMIVNMV